MSILKTLLLIRVRPGKEKEVLEKIIGIPEVLEAGIILGDYDLYALVRIKSRPEKRHLLYLLFQVIVNNIRSIDGIIITLTLITFDYLTKKKWELISTELVRPSPLPLININYYNSFIL